MNIEYNVLIHINAVDLCFGHSCQAGRNRIVVFTVAQLRKAPPKKPEGEIKPYSLMEREGEYNRKTTRTCAAFITPISSISEIRFILMGVMVESVIRLVSGREWDKSSPVHTSVNREGEKKVWRR